MFSRLKNSKAQASVAEYALLFFIVLGFIMVMSVYFKRTVQSRIRAASLWAVHNVRNQAGNVYNGALWLEYEPYYLNTAGETIYSSDETSHVLEAQGTSGIFNKEIDNVIQTQSNSVVIPPKDAQ